MSNSLAREQELIEIAIHLVFDTNCGFVDISLSTNRVYPVDTSSLMASLDDDPHKLKLVMKAEFSVIKRQLSAD